MCVEAFVPNPLSLVIPGSAVLRSGLVVMTFLAVPLAVTAAQSWQCLAPGAWGGSCPKIVPQIEPQAAVAPPESPEREAMLDATFELLTAEPEVITQKPVIDNRQLVATVEQPLQPLEPAKRMVKTTPIRVTVATAEEPDTTALALTNDSAPEDGALGAIAAVAPRQPTAVVEVAEADPVVEPEPESVAEPKPAPKAAKMASNIRIIAGQGVNVRSGPGKSKSKLFALPGGTEVTIGESNHGWLEITDAKGRTGWVYKDYLLTP